MKRNLPALLVAVALACARSPAPTTGRPGSPSMVAATDTLHGVVTIVGSDPGTWLSLRHGNSGLSIRLAGVAAEPLRSVGGASVSVMGRPTLTSFEVFRFTVRQVNGESVSDGVVTQHRNGLALALADGSSLDLAGSGGTLLQLVGSRIWITKRFPGIARTYGVISKE